MPAIVGPCKINSVDGGVVNFGDSFYLSPKDTAKTNAGAGSFNTGDFLINNSGANATNVGEADIHDQQISGNA